jgi:hypothetical protein
MVYAWWFGSWGQGQWWEKKLSQGDANKDQPKERGCIVLYCPLSAIPHYGTMMSCK